MVWANKAYSGEEIVKRAQGTPDDLANKCTTWRSLQEELVAKYGEIHLEKYYKWSYGHWILVKDNSNPENVISQSNSVSEAKNNLVKNNPNSKNSKKKVNSPNKGNNSVIKANSRIEMQNGYLMIPLHLIKSIELK